MAVPAMLLSLVILAPRRAASQVPPDPSPTKHQDKRTRRETLRFCGGWKKSICEPRLKTIRRSRVRFLPMTISGLRPDGSTASKADVLSNLGRHDRRRDPYQITATNMREHLFGDTACLTYTKIYTKPGSQAAYSENVLHLLIRRNGVWRLQLSSPLPAPARERSKTSAPFPFSLQSKHFGINYWGVTETVPRGYSGALILFFQHLSLG